MEDEEMFFKPLETDRLILKNIEKGDNQFILKEFSTDEINEFLFDCEPMSRIEDADKLIDFYLQDEPRCQHRWIIINKETGEKMGTCGFHCWDRKTARCEFGYDMQPAYWKHGYMQEAVSAIIEFAKTEMKIKHIVSEIAIGNTNSEKTSERQGFKFLGNTTTLTFHGKEYLHNCYELII